MWRAMCKLDDSKPGPGVPQRLLGGGARGVVVEFELVLHFHSSFQPESGWCIDMKSMNTPKSAVLILASGDSPS